MRGALWSGIGVMLYAGLCVLAWRFQWMWLLSGYEGGVTMKFFTASALVVCGAGLVFAWHYARTQENRAGVLLAILGAVLIFGGFDGLAGYQDAHHQALLSVFYKAFAAHDLASESVAAGVPSKATLMAFIAFGGALVAFSVHAMWASLSFGLSVAWLGLSALIGHVAGLPSLRFFSPDTSSAMAVTTALCLALVGAGIAGLSVRAWKISSPQS